MRAARYHRYGDPGVLRIDDVPTPVPAPGQVLIQVEAIGANAIDTVFRSGTGAFDRPLPGRLTGDVVGTVVALGAGTSGVTLGDRVAALSEDAFAEHVAADARWVVPVPVTADAGAAAALSMTGPLAVRLVRAARTGPGDTMLIHSAAGAVGHLAVQLARQAGARTVIGTASNPEKRAFVEALGADATVDSRDPDWPALVAAAAPDGVDVVLDAIGGRVFDQGVELLAPEGRIVAYGAIGGTLPTVSARLLFAGKHATGVSLTAWRAARPRLADADIAEFAELLDAGKVRSHVHSTHALADVRHVHELLDARANLGRVVVRP
ncbi:quinone oxidoreductase family protein [Pseudonocardia sp. GCM10023141]|uniref:quinone oxidoreductase family protein n=1 Tax=Pseudonocardia sp. GCM10023141 TaxID=3252653 RepID=UPI00361306DB